MTKERFKLVCAVHLFLIQGDNILLLRRFATGFEDGNYSVIAGHLDGGEEVITATIREAREEAGVEIQPKDLKVVGVMHRKAAEERVDFFLVATDWQGEIINNEPDKCDDLSWFSFNKLPQNMVSYVRQAIDNYQNNILYDTYGW